nr:hypothetical protein [Rhodococcus sp. (in: high G+C Gram-positive bacteria)]
MHSCDARAQLDEEWGRTPGVVRGKLLNEIADPIESNGDLLARLEEPLIADSIHD